MVSMVTPFQIKTLERASTIPNGNFILFRQMNQAKNSGIISLTVSQTMKLFVMIWDMLQDVGRRIRNGFKEKFVTSWRLWLNDNANRRSK
jgi:hypothetical protein